ncbi:MAG: fibronectin type III domain-containing protein, partial [Planctomycetia bacterium]|nr:fibronectin type III domain-containing protein [Planctomycetia bacterium]
MWSAPANDGGSDVTDYLIGYRLTGETSWTPYDDGESPNRTATVSGLSRDAGFYVFRVAAVNAIGEGAASLPSNAVRPLATAGPVAELAVKPGNEQLTATWNPPLDNGGATVFDYEIEYKNEAGTAWSIFPDGRSTASSVTIPNLVNGVSYIVRVRPVNSVGRGAFTESDAEMPYGLPGVPTGLVVSGGVGRLTASWTASSPNGR